MRAAQSKRFSIARSTRRGFSLVEMLLAVFILGIGVFIAFVNLVYTAVKGQKCSSDPWDGRTLEWATSSPPPPYNFAVLPEVRDREPLLDLKERGVATALPAAYEDKMFCHNPPKSSVRMSRINLPLAFDLPSI